MFKLLKGIYSSIFAENIFHNIKRQFKFFKQRIRCGFSDDELWGLELTIAEFCLPRLIRFKEIKCSYPGDGISEIDWDEILDKIIYSFEEIIRESDPFYDQEVEINKEYLEKRKIKIEKIQEGLDLFAKYFMNLWD